MNKFTARHTALSIIFFFSLLLFLKLDSGEIQPWDEGLYAIRAEAVNKYKAVWDQTNYSAGGLYSSTYPPLTVWIMAFNMKFMGERILAVRIFSAICGSLSFILIYLLARRLLNNDLSLLAIISLAVTTSWNYYSRQGMTDIPLMMFILLSLWILIKLLESKKSVCLILWSVLLGVSLGSGLMTKIILSFIPFGFIILAFLNNNFRKYRLPLFFAMLVAISIALPWHIYMIKLHGAEFYKAFYAPHIYSSVENNSASIGLLYYFNQLIISNPFIILTFSFIFIIIKRALKPQYIKVDISEMKYNQKPITKFLEEVLMLWFGFGFVIFSISLTKLPHYSLYLIPPALLLAGIFIRKFDSKIVSDKSKWIIFSALILSLLWSMNYDLRQGLKDLFLLKGFYFDSMFFVLLTITLLWVGWQFKSDILEKILNTFSKKVIFSILVILVVRLVINNSLFPPGNTFGGATAADLIKKYNKNKFAYMYHKHNQSDSLNPQLAWYTDNWLIGKKKGHSVINISLPKNTIDFKTLYSSDTLSNMLLIYQIPKNFALSHSIVNELSQVRPIIRFTSDYVIFGAIRYIRKSGKPV